MVSFYLESVQDKTPAFVALADFLFYGAPQLTVPINRGAP